MKLVVTINDNKKIGQIINDLEVGRRERPSNYNDAITTYWKHHLSQISVTQIEDSKICVTGESGFYFPGLTYSGLDLINTIYKRLGIMRWIGSDDMFNLSIPQVPSQKFGYKIFGKWISYDFLRSINHAHTIITGAKKANITLANTNALKIMEIGSGTGIQALVFKLLFKKSTYYLVDFPETLALAAVFLSTVLPNSKILFFDSWSKNQELLKSDEYDFVLIPNYAIDRVSSDHVDIVLNTVSMQEMNYDTIRMYFGHIRRVLKGPRLFYHCNRDKLMDGMMIELDRYPYSSEDKHIYRKVQDPFYSNQIAIRKCFGRFPLLRKIRIPIVKRGGKQFSYLTIMSKTPVV